MTALALVLHMVLLHRVDGGEVLVNPAHVTALHATASSIGQENKLLTNKVHCAVALSDGKFVSVIETCVLVKRLMEEAVP